MASCEWISITMLTSYQHWLDNIMVLTTSAHRQNRILFVIAFPLKVIVSIQIPLHFVKLSSCHHYTLRTTKLLCVGGGAGGWGWQRVRVVVVYWFHRVRPSVRLSVRPTNRVRSAARCLFLGLYSYVAQTHSMLTICRVPFPGLWVKVTRVIPIFVVGAGAS